MNAIKFFHKISIIVIAELHNGNPWSQMFSKLWMPNIFGKAARKWMLQTTASDLRFSPATKVQTQTVPVFSYFSSSWQIERNGIAFGRKMIWVGEVRMKNLIQILALATLVLGSTCLSVNAQTSGTAGLRAQVENASPPMIKETACAYWGHCPPGYGQRCAFGHCWCRPCWWFGFEAASVGGLYLYLWKHAPSAPMTDATSAPTATQKVQRV
jgi:hypothetical protein